MVLPQEDGSFGNRVGDWWDVIDLDYRNRLWQYQIDTLTYWAQWVDGFRCDVAPMVPLEFWLKAHKAVEKSGRCHLAGQNPLKKALWVLTASLVSPALPMANCTGL